jgi:hypothetical protein
MSNLNYQCHIRFIDIASNPYLISLHKGLHVFMPEAEWTIFDEEFNLFAFPGNPFNAGEDPSKENLAAGIQLSDFDPDHTSSIFDAKDGKLQGYTQFHYRNMFLGGIFIHNIPSSQRHFLEQVLRILEGYLTLLSGALEDHDDLELMHNIWAETITMIDLDVLLERVMDEICAAMNLDKGVLFLINEDSEFYPAYIRNYPASLLKLHDPDVSRHDYIEPMAPPQEILRCLPEDDPLRQWTLHSLKSMDEYLSDNPDCIAIPFYRNTYFIGIFISFVKKFEPVSDNRQSLLKLLTTGGAAALDNALTLQRMNQRRKALSTIHVVHRLISSKISTKELLPKIGQLTKQLLKVKKCAILLCNKERTKLLPKVALGLEKGEVGQKVLAMGEEIPGWVAENFNPVVYQPWKKTPLPWASIGDTYPAEAYMAVALFDTDIEGVIMIADNNRDFTPGEREILVTFAEQVIIAIKNARMHEGERTVTINALRSIANIIETHDPDKAGITSMTCDWARNIAEVLHLSEAEKRCLNFAALLHDTGMLRSLQSDISIEEQQRLGPHLSRRFVNSLGLNPHIGDIVYHVNEAWDGQGFPDGLKGSKIPLESRIIAVAHTYVQLYNKHNSNEKVLKTIHRLKNRAFDPDIVNALDQAIHNPPELEDEDE